MSTSTKTTPLGVVTTHWRRIVLLLSVVLIVGCAIFYFGFVRLYRSDYAAALVRVNQATTTYNELLGARDATVDHLGDTSQVFNQAIESYRDAFHDYTAAITSISQERALRDGEVKRAYTVLSQKNALFEEFIEMQLKTSPLVHSVVTDCSESAPSQLNTSDLSKIVEVYDGAMRPCVDAMKLLARSDNEAAAKRGSDSVVYFDAMRAHAVAMQSAYTANNRSTFESEYNALLEALTQYKVHIQVRDLLDIDKDAVPSSELNTLATTLSRYQN